MRPLCFPCGVLFFTVATGATSRAQVTMNPLITFGGGDGWLAPGDNAFLGTGNNERGIAFSNTSPTPHLYLVSRTGGLSVRVLNASTGAETGTLDVTGISGGTFILSKIAVGGDGVIYGSNLRTGTTGQTYRVYRWATESSAPTLVFDNVALGDGSRLGDDFDAIGSGTGTRLLAGYNVGGGTPAGANGYAVIDPTASAATPTTPVFNSVGFTTTPPNNGDFRLGITFVSSTPADGTGTIIGTQGGSATATRLSTYDDAAGTLTGSLTLNTINERPLDYTVVGGVPLFATIDTATSIVRLYDLTDPLTPSLLASGTTISGASVANTNAAGDVRFGAVSGNSVTLYAMNTNNGIQAFTVSIPEPSLVTLSSLTVAGLVFRRSRSRR